MPAALAAARRAKSAKVGRGQSTKVSTASNAPAITTGVNDARSGLDSAGTVLASALDHSQYQKAGQAASPGELSAGAQGWVARRPEQGTGTPRMKTRTVSFGETSSNPVYVESSAVGERWVARGRVAASSVTSDVALTIARSLKRMEESLP